MSTQSPVANSCFTALLTLRLAVAVLGAAFWHVRGLGGSHDGVEVDRLVGLVHIRLEEAGQELNACCRRGCRRLLSFGLLCLLVAGCVGRDAREHDLVA